jgi:hypothetical protein
MATSYSVFKAKFKKTIADAIYQEVTSKTARYYHWFGKENAWTDFLSPFIGSGSSDVPGQPSDNFRYDLHVRRDILTAKLIKESDVSYVVRRIDWVSGTVYDEYDDAYDTTTGYGYSPAYSGATRLEDANFYILTTEYNVYKCIWSNNNSPSEYMPTGTSPDIFSTTDGYKWKFMYTIPVSLRNRFLSSEYMPVTNSLKAQFYTSGEITSIAIENGGGGYLPATTSAVITGDGYNRFNPYAIDSIEITSGGKGYTSTPNITISDPFPSAITWSANADINVGIYVKHIDPSTLKINFYYVVSGTRLGTSGPVHVSGTEVSNGAAILRHAGQTATASSTLTGDEITIITLDTSGYGYQDQPTAIADAPIIKDDDWTEATVVTLADILQYDGRYYEVTSAGTTSLVAPTHISGAATNGTAELTYVAKDAELLPIIEKTEAEIDLVISPGIDSVYRVIVTNPSTKYTEIPSITITAPVSGTTAEAIAILSSGTVSYINVTVAGDGYDAAPDVTIDLPIKTFDGNTAVDDIAHTITYSTHRLVTGDEVIYTDGGGTTITNLTDTETYWVIVLNENTIQLANSLSNANAGTALAIEAGTGSAHILEVQTGASATATLGTGGEIVGYTIQDGGTGYTNANIEIVDTSGGGAGAILVADFNIGDIDTLQANVELLAVDGAINTIKMVAGGAGYAAATVTINGDGTGATAVATVTGGQVSHIEIVNPGFGYTWTDIIITGNVGSTGAVARAIMTPIGGHGSNALDELNASNIVFYTSISRDKNQGLEINNDYRKVGLVRNFKQFGSNRKFTGDIGSGCVLITGTFDRTKLEYDMLLTKEVYKKYRIVEFTDTQILLSVFNNFTIDVGDVLTTDPTNAGLNTSPTVTSSTILVEAVTERTIDQFSGDFLFFSVRESYSPSADQIITVRTLVEI